MKLSGNRLQIRAGVVTRHLLRRDPEVELPGIVDLHESVYFVIICLVTPTQLSASELSVSGSPQRRLSFQRPAGVSFFWPSCLHTTCSMYVYRR